MQKALGNTNKAVKDLNSTPSLILVNFIKFNQHSLTTIFVQHIHHTNILVIIGLVNKPKKKKKEHIGTFS
jgi:hypothetical protein